MSQGASLPAVAGFNVAVLLEAIRRAPEGKSRRELVESSGLSAQTVTNAIRRLLDQGLVREAGKEINGPGKPRAIFQLEPTGGYALGVHLDPTTLTCVLLDLQGSVAARLRTPSPRSGDAEETIVRSARGIEKLIADSGVERERILGVGVAAPGSIDAASGVVVHPHLIPEWNDFPVRDSLSGAVGFPVILAKDVTAAAVAERWTNATSPSNDFIFIHYGTGIGAGLVLGGKVYTGSSQNAGEIGHILVDPDGPLCPCGRRGCFEESVRPHQLVREGIERGLLMPSGDELTVDVVDDLFTELVRLSEEGNPDAIAIIDRSIRNTAVFLINVANLLDVDLAVFGGPYWDAIAARYLDQLPRRIQDTNMSNLDHPLRLLGSNLGEDVAAVGAGCLVLDEVLSPRLS